MRRTSSLRFGLLACVGALAAAPASAATFADLSDGAPGSQFVRFGPYSGPYSAPYGDTGAFAGPYASPPAYGACPQCGEAAAGARGAEGAPPLGLDAPGAATMAPMPASPTPFLPFGPNGGLPHGQLQLSTFGQVNSTTDPFNPWGLSTPFMFVPWSTPLSGWTNAQTWNWWRERSGALPRNW